MAAGDIISMLFSINKMETHEFRFIEIGKRYVRVGMILKRSRMRMTIGRGRGKM